MTTFNTLADSTYTLAVDRPPRWLNRYADRGRPGSVHTSIAGTTIKISYDATPNDSMLKLLYSVLTEAQAEMLADLMDADEVLTVRLKAGGGTFTAIFGPPSEQKFEAIVGDYPEGDRAGAALDSNLQYHRATITIYRV